MLDNGLMILNTMNKHYISTSENKKNVLLILIAEILFKLLDQLQFKFQKINNIIEIKKIIVTLFFFWVYLNSLINF